MFDEQDPLFIRNGISMWMRRARVMDQQRVLDIWCRAVDSTHHFLTSIDRKEIEEEVRDLLPQVPLWLAVDVNDRPLGFMLLEGSHLGGLFVDPLQHGMGVGRALVRHALTFYPVITTDVNEQNTQAIGFYVKLGFNPIGRAEVDDQGRPYPLIQMRVNSKAHR